MSNDKTRPIRVYACVLIEKIRGSLEAIEKDHGLAKGIQIQYVFWVSLVNVEGQGAGEIELDVPNFCLQSLLNIQRLSLS